ncbi:uncharacterized protein LOC107830463 [Nicotiana tabacum]|uniref:Uncharacterized protein LOC107830463 n=1 Tax=Nicotiana tabacum TaxID=4097 RepID=A0AC58T2Z7_TOBAC
MLYNAISGEEYEKISSCENTKEMWDMLEVIDEGTNKVKETRINLLVRDYDLFQMKDRESVEIMFSRFRKILGDLKLFGRPIKSGEHVRKFLRSLPTIWQPKVIALECQYLDKMSYNELRDDLIAFDKTHLDRNFQKKKSFGAWSDEEESDHEEITNMCFMTINEDSSEDSGELGLLANEGTSEVRLPTCPICQELQEFIDIAFADIEKVLNELRKIQREKKDWALKLEEQCKKNRKWKWYLDSACSKHMTGDKQLFKTVTQLDGGIVTFGDKSKGNVIGVGRVPLGSTCDVDEVYPVDELSYNLLSIRQLYDNDYEFHFKKHDWFIEDESGKVILCGN